jgi:hypothetical protein
MGASNVRDLSAGVFESVTPIRLDQAFAAMVDEYQASLRRE